MLGLLRLRQEAVWLELLPGSGNEAEDRARSSLFRRRMAFYRLRYCLLYLQSPHDVHELGAMKCIGMSRRELLARLGAPNLLLNLSYSLHPPLLMQFERKLLCDLDPSEMFYWMTKLEMGQSYHDEFWTIGLKAIAKDSHLPQFAPAGLAPAKIKWRTFYPLADTQFYTARPSPRKIKFTTVGQWYWGGAVEVEGEFPELSKKQAFEPYLTLPRELPQAQFELAMNLNPGDSEIERLERYGWRIVSPHLVARTASAYRRYIGGASAEFTAIKGVDVAWRTGWLSDRAAAFMASGRPVVTENTGANDYLPQPNAFRFVDGRESAVEALREICADWPRLSKLARGNAIEVFDSAKNLRKILGLAQPA